MKNFIKENWFKVGLLAILVISVAGAFYWYEWRPRGIKIHCTYSGVERVKENRGNVLDYEFLYKKCLRENGL